MDVEAWLQSLGLERYVPAFRDNEIDWEVLPKLTSEDLQEIGVAAVGHRRKLLDAIAALGAPASVVDTLGPEAETTETFASRSDAERRQLTVMFYDLVASTALSARLDPEDLRGIVGTYHRSVTEIVEGFGGFVARYMGDGVLVYFGYPQAHEDDAQRAVRAGLGWSMLSVASMSGPLSFKRVLEWPPGWCRRWGGCRARCRGRDAQSSCAAANLGRSECGRHCREYAKPGRRPFRISRSRRRRGQGHRRAGAGMAGASAERR